MQHCKCSNTIFLQWKIFCLLLPAWQITNPHSPICQPIYITKHVVSHDSVGCQRYMLCMDAAEQGYKRQNNLKKQHDHRQDKASQREWIEEPGFIPLAPHFSGSGTSLMIHAAAGRKQGEAVKITGELTPFVFSVMYWWPSGQKHWATYTLEL